LGSSTAGPPPVSSDDSVILEAAHTNGQDKSVSDNRAHRLSAAQRLGLDVPVTILPGKWVKSTKNEIILAGLVDGIRSDVNVLKVSAKNPSLPSGILAEISDLSDQLGRLVAWACPDDSNSLNEAIHTELRRELSSMSFLSSSDGPLTRLKDELKQDVLARVSQNIHGLVADEVARMPGKRPGDHASGDSYGQSPHPKRRQVIPRRSAPNFNHRAGPSQEHPSQQAPPPITDAPSSRGFPNPPPLASTSQARFDSSSELLLGPSSWYKTNEELYPYVRRMFVTCNVPHLADERWSARALSNGYLSIQFANNAMAAREFVRVYNGRARPQGWEFIDARVASSPNV